jgi:hypothetical protein
VNGANKLIFIIFFIGYVVGTGVTLLSQYINKHVEISVSFDHKHDFH